MRPTAIAGGIVALAVAVWAMPRNQQDGLRGDPAAASVLAGAIEFFEARLRSDPIDASAAGALASRYVLRFQRLADLEDLRRAERVINSTLLYAGDGSAAQAQLSAIRLMQHDFVGAYAAARDAVQHVGANDDALGAWFDAALATGRFDEAKRALAGMDERSLATQVRRSHWLDANGDAQGAFAALSSVCEQVERSGEKPDITAWCLTELAGLEHTLHGEAAAKRLYRKVLGIMPGYRAAIEGLGDLHHANREWRRAIAKYEQIAVDAHPDLYLRLAESNRELGSEDRAREWEAEFLRAAGGADVERLFAHPLAMFLAEQPHSRDRALEIALRDVASRPAPESFDVLAWVHLQRGDAAAALVASDRAQAHTAPTPTMAYHRARILHALGSGDRSAVLLAEAAAQRSQLDPAARIDLDRFMMRQ
jgi:tetratricopeptide (TPR) repeat protein